MTEMYVSWAKGLPQSKEALAILRKNNLGVEMSNIDEQVEMIQDAGVRFSAHTPGLNLTINLASPGFFEYGFRGEWGHRLSEIIRKSDAPTVGFHLGYSAKKVYKMMAFPNVPQPESLITDRTILKHIFVEVLTPLAMWYDQKQVLIETLDYSRERPIPWNIQPEEIRKDSYLQKAIKKTVKEYGVNAALLYVTEPKFVQEVFELTDQRFPAAPLGFIFDTAHNFISADAKISKDEFQGPVQEYFRTVLNVVKDRTRQIHLAVPDGDEETGYNDHHLPFSPGNRISDQIIDLSKMVWEQTKGAVQVVTLEVKTGLEPVKHAIKMIEQAEYVVKELGINIT